MTLDRLLAVSHEGALGGAPIVLADLLGWMTTSTSIRSDVLMLEGGPMWGRFEAVGSVHGLGELSQPNTEPKSTHPAGDDDRVPLLARTRRHERPRPTPEPAASRLGEFDLALLNSLGSLDAAALMPAGVPIVSWIHELDVALQMWLVDHDLELLRAVPDVWIAASPPIVDMLVNLVGVPADRVLLHHSFIDVRAIEARTVGPREVEERRRSLGIPRDATVVMGSGTIDWRKGPDLFVQLACQVRRHSPDPIHFVWVGGATIGADRVRLDSDIRRSGADHVHVTGTLDDPVPTYQIADVFALTSREDPFPLVCLEQATLGKPVVTFRNGGTPELLESAGSEAAAGVFDHLDVNAMTDRVLELVYDEQRRREAGDQLRTRVLGHHDVLIAAPRLLRDLVRITEEFDGPRTPTTCGER